MYAYLTHGSLPPTLRSNPKERDSWSVHRAKWAAAGKRALTLADARFQKDIQQRHSWQYLPRLHPATLTQPSPAIRPPPPVFQSESYQSCHWECAVQWCSRQIRKAQVELQWIVAQRLLSALTAPGFR